MVRLDATAPSLFPAPRPLLRVVPYERTSGRSSMASEAELKGVEVCRD
jgi:hypothetical protein